jgi:N6-adenosine-specific RNA methylase IME4
MTRYEIEPGVFRADPFEGLPRGHFKAIYADPPWHFEVWKEGGNRNVTSKYSTMAAADIAALPVADLAAEDCVLFVWIVWPRLKESLDIIDAWGFTYKTCAFSWIKADDRQPDMFSDSVPVQLGMGYWTRANSEVCLLATKGKPKRLDCGVRQGIVEPRREHSRKPDCVPSRIERLVGGPYLELFARTQRPGWTVWGNQTDKFTPAEVAA